MSTNIPLLQLSPLSFTGAVLYYIDPVRAVPSNAGFPMTLGLPLAGNSIPSGLSVGLRTRNGNGSLVKVKLIRMAMNGAEDILLNESIGVPYDLEFKPFTMNILTPRVMLRDESLSLQLSGDYNLEVGNVLLLGSINLDVSRN